jgi:foldase protein PrsA
VARISAKGGKSAGLQRLALLAFGALFILLFVIFAVAQGIGNPSVPSDAVAVVEDAPNEPDDLGTVTKDEFQHALVQTAAQAKVTPVPKPGDKKYEELKETALGEVLDGIWIQGQAEEMGVVVTEKEVADELKKLKKQAFKTEKQYEEFLKEAHYTQADVEQRVKIQILSEQIQNQVTEEAPVPTKSEIKDYYEAARASQYTTPESRDIRVAKNKDKAKVEEAKAALETDDSDKNWEKVAKKYTTKSTGGLQSAVTEGGLGEPLDGEVFAASQGEIKGPLSEGGTYTIFEVMKVTPEKVQSLTEAQTQINAQLAEQAKQQNFAAFVQNYGTKWQSRTFCASDFTIARCSNYKSDGRPPEANEACFEADPKTPAEACPAPIPQVKPAQPGTVSPLNPEGQKLAQRPQPSKLEEGAALPEGEIPGGAVPGATGE